jgi:hypothetical protein
LDRIERITAISAAQSVQSVPEIRFQPDRRTFLVHWNAIAKKITCQAGKGLAGCRMGA